MMEFYVSQTSVWNDENLRSMSHSERFYVNQNCDMTKINFHQNEPTAVAAAAKQLLCA